MKQRGAFRLHALDEDALAAGLVPGMALADARARLPDLVALPHDPEGEVVLMERLADLCDRFTPMVAIDAPDGLALDITGCAHLFGGEAALIRDAVRLMRAQGMSVRAARAATPEAALALARLSPALSKLNPCSCEGRSPGRDGAAGPWAPASAGAHGGIPISTGEAACKACRDRESAAIARLPLLALRLDPETLLALRRAGFGTLGELARLPPAPLAARFGAGLVDALDRLLGRRDSRITPRRLPPPIQAERRFAEPVARVETVMAVLGELLREACKILAERHQGGRRFAVRLYRSDGAMRDLAVETGQGVRDPAIVLRLFAERIEALSDPLDPGFGFDIIRLAVPAMEALETAQVALDGARAKDADLAALLDRLGVRAGPRRFRRLVPRDTHLPERVTRLMPVATPDLPAWDRPQPGEPPLRPLSLLDPPERVEVMAQVPDGPPRRFRWRGSLHMIIRQEGPERIAPEWWRRLDGHAADPGLTRDYYRVEDEQGGRFWVYRDGLYERETDAPHWYVHGLFA